jgi:hypothetical protein
MMTRIASAGELNALVESYELEIECRHCGWCGQRTLGWLAAHRDTNCPACRGVIVLNTSERRREISALRRQVAALHEQLSGSISSAENVLAGAQAAQANAPKPAASRLSLWHLYGNKTRTALSDRRITRSRR